MLEKYKINSAAADFKSTVKEVAAVIKTYTGTEKKSGAVLTTEEINVLFSAMTINNAVESFDEYFSMGKAAREEADKAKRLKKIRILPPRWRFLSS